jgi:delta 1-pyrroline-5-carboxylate dehydrogenase
VLEAGKHWCEADADVCEAADFLNYFHCRQSGWQRERLPI